MCRVFRSSLWSNLWNDCTSRD